MPSSSFVRPDGRGRPSPHGRFLKPKGRSPNFPIPLRRLFCHNCLCTPACTIFQHNSERGNDVGKVHLCNRRCGVFIGQGTGGGFYRLPVGKPWSQGQSDEV